jgi:hypothetical protein
MVPLIFSLVALCEEDPSWLQECSIELFRIVQENKENC